MSALRTLSGRDCGIGYAEYIDPATRQHPDRPTLTFGSTAPDRHPERARRTVRRGGRRRPAGSVTPPQVCGNVRIVIAYLERGRRAACGRARGPPGLVKTSNPQLFLRLVVQHPSSDVPFHATANSPG